MLTSRYHIGSIIAIFIALGIGILVGGTLGQQWMHQTEQNLVAMVMEKYDKQVMENQKLQKQVGSLELMSQSITPILDHKKIIWIRPQSLKNDMLPLIMKSAGADFSEQNSTGFKLLSEGGLNHKQFSSADILIISDPSIADPLKQVVQEWKIGDEGMLPIVIDFSSHQEKLNEPQDIVDFVQYLKHIIEEETNAAVSFYHYPGME